MATETKFGNFLKGTGNFIKENPKPIIYIGGSVVAVILVAAIVKKIKAKITGSEVKGGKYNKQDVDPKKLSISTSTAKNFAEQLFIAMNYTYGTDKAVLDAIFSKINTEDFKLIYNEFGVRSYSSVFVVGGSPSASERLLGTYNDIDLVEWLNNELGYGDGTLKNKIRPIVDGAGFVLEK